MPSVGKITVDVEVNKEGIPELVNEISQLTSFCQDIQDVDIRECLKRRILLLIKALNNVLPGV